MVDIVERSDASLHDYCSNWQSLPLHHSSMTTCAIFIEDTGKLYGILPVDMSLIFVLYIFHL